MFVLSAQVESVGRVFLSRRPFVAGALGVWTMGHLSASAAPRQQLTVVTLMMAVGFTLFSVEAFIARTRAIGARWLFTSLLVTTAALSGLSTALGGLNGPFLPMLLAPCGVGFAAFGVDRRAFGLLGLTFVALVSMSQVTPFPPLPAEVARWLSLGATLASAVLLLLGVGGLSAAYVRAAEQVVRSSDAVVSQAHARVRSVEELNGHFAHELKNPLAALKALIELMTESAQDEKSTRRLEVARGEVQRLEQTLERGLDFSKPSTPAVRTRGDLCALVRDVLEVLAPQAERKRVQLRSEGEVTAVDFDAPRLREAVLNLVLNALDATREDTVIVVRSMVREGDVVLEVQDAGPPLSEAALGKLGTPFFTTRAGGTGLGVAMARQVAAQHGGSLTYSSEAKGTCAMLRFPVEMRS